MANIKYNPFTGTFDIVYHPDVVRTLEDLSKPPPGCRKVKNLYVNEEGKTVVEFKDEPEE